MKKHSQFVLSALTAALVAVLGIPSVAQAAEARTSAAFDTTALPATGTLVHASGSITSDFASPLKAAYRFTANFGGRCPSVIGSSTYHGAVDLAAPDGSSIYSVAAGKVTKIVQPSGDSIPGEITVDHGTYQGKSLKTIYTHMWKPSTFVHVGQAVKKGQIIAQVGASGVATGPHLHFNVYIGGVNSDPQKFFAAHGLDLRAHATSSVSAASAPAVCKGMRPNGRLAVHSQPNFTSALVTVLPNNVGYAVHSGIGTNGFAKVDLPGGGSGWAWISDVSGRSAAKAPSIDPTTIMTDSRLKNVAYKFPKGATLYIRSMPSYDLGTSDILYLAGGSNIVTATGRTIKNTQWKEVSLLGVTGWLVDNKTLIKTTAPKTITVIGVAPVPSLSSQAPTVAPVNCAKAGSKVSGTVVLPQVTGMTYSQSRSGSTVTVKAVAKAGYAVSKNYPAQWKVGLWGPTLCM